MIMELNRGVYHGISGRCLRVAQHFGNRKIENYRELEQFLDSPRVVTLPNDEDTTEFYARFFQELREKGKPVSTNDLWIAATALQHGFVLATHDIHFSNISGIITAGL